MEVKVQVGATGTTYLDAVEIRKKVFIEEQGIDPVDEFDENENLFTYYVGYENNQPVVTARSRKIADDNDTWVVQRVATIENQRRRQLGQQLFSAIEKRAQQKQISKIRLHAQESAEPFYFVLGYQRVSGPEMEAGIKHYWMEKNIEKE